MKRVSYFLIVLFLVFFGCKNRDVNPVSSGTLPMHERNAIDPKEFDTVRVGGHDYFIMERDRNNPHEGFGFMSLNPIRMIEKQDSILAYQQLLLRNQIRIIEKLENVPAVDLEVEMQQELEYLLNKN
ncbi:MAG: hypothetical protein AAFQ94_08525 [Bacteroidota bacterium]